MKRKTRIMLGGLALAVTVALIGPWLAIGAGAQSTEFSLVSGWFRDREVKYYDFGMNTGLASGSTVESAPIYVFIHGMNADGTPDFVEGQHNIVDVRPGDDGYSDLWQVMMVTVPSDYEPDSITSKEEIDDAGLEVTATDMFVNCPIVPAGSTLEDGPALTQGWYKGEEVFYPDFGANSPVAIPIYVFIHGMNADGTPDFVEGQANIIDAVPGDAGYSAFWRVTMVTVPAGYTPNSIRSADAVTASGFTMTQTDLVVNCPVTEVAPASTAPPATGATPPAGTAPPVAAPDTGAGRPADGSGSWAWVALGLLAAGVSAAIGAGALVSVRPK